MTALVQDLRFALRMLAKRPGYTAALLLVLALGIGGTTAMFTIVDGVLLQPLPFKDPGRIVEIGGAERVEQGDSLVWWGQGKAFSALAEYQSGGVNFSDRGRSERVFATTVSASFFPLLGIGPETGRTFSPEDETSRQSDVVVLSHRFWTRVYGAQQDALGHTVVLNGQIYAIVGIMPPGFGFPGHTDLWIPRRGTDINAMYALDLGSDKQPDLPPSLLWGLLARLHDGVSVEQARVELRSLLQLESRTFHPERHVKEFFIGAQYLQNLLVGESRTSLLALLGAVGFLLLIACVNVANMILVRTAARQKEVALRLCLGASRGRILRQMLTESTLVACLGGAAGVFVAYASLRAAQLFGPKDVPRLADIHLDLRALGFAVGLSVVTGVLVGLAPALQTMTQDLTRALKEETSRSTAGLKKHLRAALVVTEVALTLVLLGGAGLMIRSLSNLLRTPPGFETQNILSAELVLPQAKYAPKPTKGQEADTSHIATFYHRLAEEIGQLPGVIAAGEVNTLPMGGKSGGGYYIEAGKLHSVLQVFEISGDYFRAMGIPILEGRGFSERDLRAHENVIVINKALAKAAWPGEDPLGKIIKVSHPGPRWPPKEVIGVVNDVKAHGLGETSKRQGETAERQYYLPSQELDMTLVVRTAGDPRSLVEDVRESVRRIDAGVPLFNVRTMKEVIADSTSAPRFRGIVVSVFAALALVLAGFGLYSVVGYSVACRTHELGVRMALGAQPRDILLMVTREGMWLALAGIALGALASFWLNKLIAGLLYGVKPNDPASLAAAAALLGAATITASLLPAMRASRTDPACALRHE